MPLRLHRSYGEGDDHFITFSGYHRLPYLNSPASRDLVLPGTPEGHAFRRATNKLANGRSARPLCGREGAAAATDIAFVSG